MYSLIAPLALGLAAATSPGPEVERPVVKPQRVGQLHTLRTIPEACIRLEGQFTGEAEEAYRVAALPTHPRCQPRARFRLEAAAAVRPDGPDAAAAGERWRLNDVIRVPSAECAKRQAVVQVWRSTANATPPALDAQGRARIHLADLRADGPPLGQSGLGEYVAALTVEDGGCRRRRWFGGSP